MKFSFVENDHVLQDKADKYCKLVELIDQGKIAVNPKKGGDTKWKNGVSLKRK